MNAQCIHEDEVKAPGRGLFCEVKSEKSEVRSILHILDISTNSIQGLKDVPSSIKDQAQPLLRRFVLSHIIPGHEINFFPCRRQG
jgi:hypothetical protein